MIGSEKDAPRDMKPLLCFPSSHRACTGGSTTNRLEYYWHVVTSHSWTARSLPHSLQRSSGPKARFDHLEELLAIGRRGLESRCVAELGHERARSGEEARQQEQVVPLIDYLLGLGRSARRQNPTRAGYAARC